MVKNPLPFHINYFNSIFPVMPLYDSICVENLYTIVLETRIWAKAVCKIGIKRVPNEKLEIQLRSAVT